MAVVGTASENIYDVSAISVAENQLRIAFMQSSDGVISNTERNDLSEPNFWTPHEQLEYRLAVAFETLYSQVELPREPAYFTVVIPGNTPRHQVSAIASGFAKFKGTVFDYNLGVGDGSLNRCNIVSDSMALVAGSISVYAEALHAPKSNKPEICIALHLGDVESIGVMYLQVWDDNRTVRFRITKVFRTSPVPVDDPNDASLLDRYAGEALVPLLRDLEAALIASGKTSAHCAFTGSVADHPTVQRSAVAKFSCFKPWFPERHFLTSVLLQGGNVLGLGRCTPKSFIKVHCFTPMNPDCDFILDQFVAMEQGGGLGRMIPRNGSSFSVASGDGGSGGILPRRASRGSFMSSPPSFINSERVVHPGRDSGGSSDVDLSPTATTTSGRNIRSQAHLQRSSAELGNMRRSTSAADIPRSGSHESAPLLSRSNISNPPSNRENGDEED